LVDEDGSNQFLPLLQHCVHDKQLYQQLMALHELLYQQQSFQLAIESLPLEIFSLLLHRYSDIKQPQINLIGVRQLRELRDYLMANLADKIHLSDLAKLCQLSESQLLRQFKRKVGITPYAWLARLRLEQALQLLKAGATSTQVCYQVGFYDQAHFIKAFNHAYGLTPSQVFQ
jgi:AraC-like DNA-binding protein